MRGGEGAGQDEGERERGGGSCSVTFRACPTIGRYRAGATADQFAPRARHLSTEPSRAANGCVWSRILRLFCGNFQGEWWRVDGAKASERIRHGIVKRTWITKSIFSLWLWWLKRRWRWCERRFCFGVLGKGRVIGLWLGWSAGEGWCNGGALGPVG